MRLIREQLQAYDEAFEVVQPRDVPGLQPNSQFPVHDALYVENALCVDTSELMPALEAACERSVSLARIHDAVTSIERDGDFWKASTANGGGNSPPRASLSAPVRIAGPSWAIT